LPSIEIGAPSLRPVAAAVWLRKMKPLMVTFD
jgi:hypothetical protein